MLYSKIRDEVLGRNLAKENFEQLVWPKHPKVKSRPLKEFQLLVSVSLTLTITHTHTHSHTHVLSSHSDEEAKGKFIILDVSFNWQQINFSEQFSILV